MSVCSYDEVELYRKQHPEKKVLNLADEEPEEVNIADISYMSNQIIEILEFMNLDSTQNLKDGRDDAEFKETIEKKFPRFAMNYYSILKLLISGASIENLLEMLKTLHEVKTNKLKFEDAEKTLGEKLAKEYVYPKMDKKKGKKKRRRN